MERSQTRTEVVVKGLKGPFARGVAAAGAVVLTALPAARLEAQGDRSPSLVRDVVIDGSEHVLTAVGSVLLGAGGGLAVSQSRDGTIRFFDSAGRPAGTAGRKGKGPGEFQAVSVLGWRADTLMAYDLFLRRFTFIASDHRVIRTEPAPLRAVSPGGAGRDLQTFPFVMPYARHADGSVLASVDAGANTNTSFALLDREGTIVRMLAVIPRENEQVVVRDGAGKPGAVAYLPISSSPVAGASPDGGRLVVANATTTGTGAGTFQVISFNARGDTVFSRRFPFQPDLISKHMADSLLDAAYTRLRRSGDVALAAAFKRDARIPPMYPPLKDLLVGADGTIWVGMRSGSRGRPYHRISASGAPMGVVLLSADARVVAADASHVWTVERDQDDVESVMRYSWRP